uniref:Pre-rRNA-processing protein TSR1 homolog n=1 Tax=Hucho hucho TaxID=62062 RepID=A0A4W5Q3K5_9TELE
SFLCQWTKVQNQQGIKYFFPSLYVVDNAFEPLTPKLYFPGRPGPLFSYTLALLISCVLRFQRYRGLKSFRSSPWDSVENLPADYSRIFQFQSFEGTRRRILAEAAQEEEGAVCVCVCDILFQPCPLSVPHHPLTLLCSLGGLVCDHPCSGCSPHGDGECPGRQASGAGLLTARRHLSNTDPMKSKEELVFHCGFRRFRTCPIFSQHTSGMQDLVGTGSLLSWDPQRVVLKRIVLTPLQDQPPVRCLQIHVHQQG